MTCAAVLRPTSLQSGILKLPSDFIARPDIETQSANSIAAWLSEHSNAEPGTVTSIAGRMHVASIGRDGTLQLTPVLDL